MAERNKERERRESEDGNLASSKRDQRILLLFRAGAGSVSSPFISPALTLSPPPLPANSPFPPQHKLTSRCVGERREYTSIAATSVDEPRSSRMSIASLSYRLRLASSSRPLGSIHGTLFIILLESR